MPEGIPYASTNVIAGAGLELNYVGNHVYGYSGLVSINNETKTGLLFTSGNKIIKSIFTFGVDLSALGANKLMGYDIFFNDVIVFGSRMYSHESFGLIDNDPVPLIIPPYTKVEIQHITTSASDNPTYGVLTGKIL